MENPSSDSNICYELKLIETTVSTGYFTATPHDMTDFTNGLKYLSDHPLDEFMRKHLIGMIVKWPEDKIAEYIDSLDFDKDALPLSLICETCLLTRRLNKFKDYFSKKRKRELQSQTSMIYIKSDLLGDHDLHARWAHYFHANIYKHRPLPPPNTKELQLLFDQSIPDEPTQEKNLKVIYQNFSTFLPPETSTFSAGDTAKTALDRLKSLNILIGQEQRHESSLSPYALLHQWKLDRRIVNQRMDYQLKGTQTAYGKGIELDSARASYAMEIVERYSAYASVEKNGSIPKLHRPQQLVYGRQSELKKQGHKVLDPNSLGLEVSYNDEPLNWIESTLCDQKDSINVLIPAQCVFLFSNLDEISLYSGLGSTGLAAGNTLSEAKLNALLEILERDCEAVNPYHPSRCFRIVADDQKVNALLSDYHQRGIHIQFQDISPAFGVPCCKCFVVSRDGSIAKGASAHLDGKKAVLAALTETPYPYPYGPPSMPITMDLPILKYEDLPDFSSNHSSFDLKLLETVLCANGLAPHYVELSRTDLDLPVVKALIPGLEIMNDFDKFARISPRLFNNYLKIFGL